MPIQEVIAEIIEKGYTNVLEPWQLWDTVAAHNDAGVNGIPGWFTTLAAMGAQPNLSFFNQRSVAIGKPYCNLDQRDTMPFPFILESVGVAWFANTWTTYDTEIPGGDPTDPLGSPEDATGQIFCADLPRHVGALLNVKQDTRLKINAMMLQPGSGPFGGGFARSQPSAGANNVNGYDHHLNVVTQGMPHKEVKYPLPEPIGIPREANLSVVLDLNEYARQFLTTAPANQVQPTSIIDQAADDFFNWPAFYGITITLHGYRLAQQRGQYHV
jgi:hypothetical protein